MTETHEPGGWDLSDLFPSANGPEMGTAMEDLERLTTEFESVRGELTPDLTPEGFLTILDRMEDLTGRAQRIAGFAGLNFAQDTQDQAAQVLEARIMQLMAGLQNRVLFFELWWKGLEDGEAAPYLRVAGDRAYWLEMIRKFKPHTLSEPEERVVNIKNVTGAGALTTLYDTMTNRYVYQLAVDGEAREMTRGGLMVYAKHHDPDLRAAAYQELYRVYGQDGPVLGQMYQTLVRDWKNEHVGLRHHTGPMAVRNLGNDLPDEVVDLLLRVCRENAPLFQRFFQLKAGRLGLPKLRRYDIYAPLKPSDRTYTFQEAVDLVMEAFGAFNPEFAELSRRVFRQGHIDSEVRRGKRDGAFCASVHPRLTPWVLLNYQGKPNDVATLAHELGHAVHAMLAAHHSIFTCDAVLPLAENASTFCEMLLIDHLLEGEADEDVRRELLFRRMDDAYATIMRQAFFALFEKTAHDLTDNGATAEELSAAYLANLTDQFGGAVEVSQEFRWEWVSIPHIYHTPFYVYAYSFGQLLVFSLYKQYKTERESFLPRYVNILSSGGAASPEAILDAAGLDIRRQEFWQGGFDVVREMLGRLEELGAA